MTALLIGYARVSTDAQDLTAQRDGLLALGVDPGRLYVDHGLTGTNRERAGLREALAAYRLARSLPDARAIAEELTVRQVRLSLGGSVYDPHDPVGRLLFNVLAMVAESESDLIRLRTKEGMRVARAKGNPAKKPTSWASTGRASTAPPSSPTCSASPAPPSTGLCNATRRTVTEQRRTARAFAGEFRRRRPQGCPAGQTLRDNPSRRTWPTVRCRRRFASRDAAQVSSGSGSAGGAAAIDGQDSATDEAGCVGQ
jgi:Resolvase, N terminal domain